MVDTRDTVNDYLRAARSISFGLPDVDRLAQLNGAALRTYITACVEARDRLVAQYSWAIPNDEALDVLTTLAPLIEIGAGTGYWAHLLRQRGVDILAFDVRPPVSTRHGNAWHRNHLATGTCWTEVRHGTPALLRDDTHADRTLFLCWPPPGPMAARALRWYGGDTVALIGCGPDETGDQELYARLNRAWHCVARVSIPRWPTVPDELVIWKR
jgi:hypothetical protein